MCKQQQASQIQHGITNFLSFLVQTIAALLIMMLHNNERKWFLQQSIKFCSSAVSFSLVDGYSCNPCGMQKLLRELVSSLQWCWLPEKNLTGLRVRVSALLECDCRVIFPLVSRWFSIVSARLIFFFPHFSVCYNWAPTCHARDMASERYFFTCLFFLPLLRKSSALSAFAKAKFRKGFWKRERQKIPYLKAKEG